MPKDSILPERAGGWVIFQANLIILFDRKHVRRQLATFGKTTLVFKEFPIKDLQMSTENDK